MNAFKNKSTVKVAKTGVVGTPKTNKFDAAAMLDNADAWGVATPVIKVAPRFIDAPVPKISVWSSRGGKAVVSTMATTGVTNVSAVFACSLALTKEQVEKREKTRQRIAAAKLRLSQNTGLVKTLSSGLLRKKVIPVVFPPYFGTKPTSTKEVSKPNLRKRRAPPSPGDFRPLVKAILAQPRVESFWDNSPRFSDLVSPSTVFTERARATAFESPRQVAPKVETFDERVIRDFTINTDNGASLQILETDFRYAVRHPRATIAVESAGDFKSMRNGRRAPLTYLYDESLYPRPSADDYVNSHVCRQDVSGKAIYTLVTRLQTATYTKAIDLGKALQQLSLTMTIAGDSDITLPFLHTNVKGMKVGEFLTLVTESLLANGINVRLVTTSPGLYFAALSNLRGSSVTPDDIATDNTTPKNWTPVAGNMHYHKCYACDTVFSHWHAFFNADHPQFDNQCPNKECSQYHKGRNFTNSQVVSMSSNVTSGANNDVLLQDPRWVKEASVFPAAIETAIEGFGKLFNYAHDLLPKVIPDTSKEEVIQLRKTGYAGAVVNNRTPKLIYISKAIGLHEIRERKPKLAPVKEIVKVGSKHTKERQFPVNPKHTWVPKGLGEEFCNMSGRLDNYNRTYYRSGLTRRQAKLSAHKASAWVYAGCPPDWSNKYAPLLDLQDTDVKEVKQPSHYPEDHVEPKIKPKSRKIKLSDEYWMDFFKNGSPINITYEMPRNIHRLAKKAGIKARHATKSNLPSVLDVVGPISTLAEVTSKVFVITSTDELIPCDVLSATMDLAMPANSGWHQVGTLRTFQCGAILKSGDPILNSRMQLCSIVTASDGDGKYCLHTKDTVSATVQCTGMRCNQCKLNDSLVWHNNPPKQKPKRKSKKAASAKRAPATNIAKVVAETRRSVELTIRAQHHSAEIGELTKRMAKLNADAKRMANATSAIVPVAVPKNKGKKKATAKTSNVLSRALSTATGGLIGATTSASTALILATLCVLSFTPIALGCFSGFTDQQFVAGRINCGSYVHNSTHGHYLNPGLGGSRVGSNVILDPSLKQKWDYLNAVVSDLVPCNVILSKRDNGAIIDGVPINADEQLGSFLWNTWILIVAAVLIVLCLIKRTQSSNKRPKRNGPYQDIVELAVMTLFVSTVIVESNAAIISRYSEPINAKPEDVVVNATEWLQKFSSFFNTKALSLKQLKQGFNDLDAIKKSLDGVGEKGMTPLAQIGHLKKSLLDRVNSVESLTSQLKALKNDTDRLKAEIENLRRALSDAATAFTEYELIFKRSAEIPWDNLDEISEQDLEDDVDLFTNMKNGFIEDIAKLERSKKDVFGGSLALDSKRKDEPEQMSLLAANDLNTHAPVRSGERKATVTRSSGNEQTTTAPTTSTAESTTSDKPKELGYISMSDLANVGKVKESVYKTKFGVNGDTACDSKGAAWYLYEGWETCDTHCQTGTAVGSGWDTCSIGNSYQKSNRILVKKNTGPRKLCSVSCFDVNYIIKAMRYNVEVQTCWGPLVFSNHWKITGDTGDVLEDITASKGFIVLSGKLVIIKSDKSTVEYPYITRALITECCSGLLSDSLDLAGSFYDGPCLCKPSLHNVERRIKSSVLEYYKNYVPSLPAVLSARTMVSIGIVVATAFMSAPIAVAVGLSMFIYNANAECSIKNYHTLYVGDSSSKQIYTTLYMRVGDCFTLGENTFELIDIDNTYKYKKAATYPTQFVPVCTDIDWGCGLSEGSKICADYNKDCKTKCDAMTGTIYKTHCIHTTTFHGDGCFGFMVQDHSVSVHGGTCLLTNASTPYYGYSKVEGLVSRKFTFKVSAFDQSRTIVVDSKDLIFEDVDFTIQDIVFDKTRIPTYVLDAGAIMCAYTDVTGNDFCHSVVSDTSKLTNPGCVNLDWTFLGDSATWQISDYSAVITPYVYDLFEACNTEVIKKDGDVIDVAPTDITLAFKIDSTLVTSAIKVTRCASATLGGHDSIPGFVDRVQMTTVSVSIKSTTECYVSVALDKCSLLGVNFCKVTTEDTTCIWVVYCPIVTDLEVSINGVNEIGAFNVTSGKFSAPTIEYSRIIMTTARTSMWNVISDVSSGFSKATNWIPGVSAIKSILSLSMNKALWVVVIFAALYACWMLQFYTGFVCTLLFAWLYFFTSYVHADNGQSTEEDEILLWHVLAFLIFISIDWVKLVRVVYTYVCRRASGLWHRLGCSNFVVGTPLIDRVLLLLSCALIPHVRICITCCHLLSNCVHELYLMFTRPQSAMFNTEELNHTPIAAAICNYVSANSQAIGDNTDGTIQDFMLSNVKTVLNNLPSTSFVGDIGTHMYNSPSDELENEPIDVDQYFLSDEGETFYDAEVGTEVNTLPPPPEPRSPESIAKLAESAVSSEEVMIDGVPRHIYVGESPFRSARQPKVEIRPWSDLDAVSVASSSQEHSVEKAKPKNKLSKVEVKLKKKFATKVVIVLHPMSHKYAFELSVELNRLGRVSVLNKPDISDTVIVCKPEWDDRWESYFFDVPFTPEHLRSLNISRENYESSVSMLKRHDNLKTFTLSNAKKETLFKAVCNVFVEDYDYSMCGKSAPRYYVTVPVGGGFDLLEPKTVPSYEKCPKWNMTALEKADWAYGVNFYKLLVLPQRYTNVPKNWVYVASVYIPGKANFVSEIAKFKYPKDTHKAFSNAISALQNDPRSVPVKSLPSLVTALNIVARSTNQRRDDIEKLARPDMQPIFKRVRDINDTDACCAFYSVKADVGDYIKFTVPDVTVSVFKSNVADFINETQRTFLVFRNKDKTAPKIVASEYGHLSALGKVLANSHMSPEQYCKRVVFGKDKHILYVVANRDSLEDIINVDILNKGITSAKIQAVDSSVRHIYVCFGDSKIKKFFNHHIPQLIHNIGTRGIELTFLIGRYGDMRTVCSHVNAGMKVISNGQPIGFETSLDLVAESTRKDLVSKDLKRAAAGEAETQFYEVSLKFIVDELERGIIIYRVGRIEQEGWTTAACDAEFSAIVNKWRRYDGIKDWGREQFWLYDGDKEKIVGLLPNDTFRPKHFGLQWEDTINPGDDVQGPDIGRGSQIYLPVVGDKDKGNKATYKTYPIVAQDGSLNYCIYTTEMSGNIGHPVVLSEKRLMSGANVYVANEEVDKPEAFRNMTKSSGFITTCSRVKLLGIDCYLHKLELLKDFRMREIKLDYLNSEARFTLRNLKSANALVDIFKKPVEDFYRNVGAPKIHHEEVVGSTLEVESSDIPNDPTAVPEVVDLAAEESAGKEWYLDWAGFNFTRNEMTISFDRESEARACLTTDESSYYQGHVMCPVRVLSLDECPLLDERDGWFNNCDYADKKLFCSLYCGQVHKNLYKQRWVIRGTPAWHRLTSGEGNVEHLSGLMGGTMYQMSHPCLPELDRLCNALSRPGFNRRKWYDNILEGIEDDHVFYAFQIANQKRLTRLNRELDATCSELFDFPDTWYGSHWCTPCVIERGHISSSYVRINALCIHCTIRDQEENFNDFPLLVKAKTGEDNIENDDFYVKLRRACLLLLAQGWNSFDVVLDKDAKVNIGRFVTCCTFNQYLFGPHTINIVTIDQTLLLELMDATQLVYNLELVPECLKVGSDFLMKRGVKTAAILESLSLWHSTRKVNWIGVDVARLGLSSTDCPEMTVTTEDRPTFMGDSMCAIWNISNGIRTGTCYSNGMDIVGSNHCTMGNNIVVETPAPLNNSMSVRRAKYINRIVKSYEGGDVDMHNGMSVYSAPRKGEIYAVVNPAQKRGRWLMCTATDEYEPVTKARFHKFVPVEVDFASNSVSLADYRLFKGLSGSPIISARGQCAGTYGLSTNVKYSDKSVTGNARDTTMCHAMVTDNAVENENYFIEAARELVQSNVHEWRFSYLEAPTGTGKSTLFPIAILHAIARVPSLATYSICMLEPTRAAVHNCYNRVLALLKKTDDKWKRIYTLRLSTGKRGDVTGENFKSEGNGKIQLCIATYGRFIAEYQPESTRPHAYNMLLMDEIHTRSNDEDVGTAYLLSSDRRADSVKICYMTATSVGKVCEKRLCEGKDLSGTRFKITKEYLVETRKSDAAKEGSIVSDSSYFTIDLRKARLNLKTKAQYVSWPMSAHAGGRCLVFLPSRNDCEKFVGWARTNYPKLKDRFTSLHAGSPVKDLETLHPEAIIGCTDYASTAITVPNCKAVIDFMEDWSPSVTLFQNEIGYTYKNTVSKDVVSKQVSVQRMGRTGRTCDGHYFSCASITPVEETRLSESMYARIYFNLLIKMGKPRLLKAFLRDTEESNRIYEHEWLEPDRIADDWMDKGDEVSDQNDKDVLHKFILRASRRLQVVRDWDKDQLWWYLNPVVGRDYISFCYATENEKTHGFGVSSVKVNLLLQECWTVVDTDAEAKDIRSRLNFSIDSYKEDMDNFDNYVQRAHDTVGAISIDTLARRAQKTAKKMYDSIDKSILTVESDAAANITVEAAEDEPTSSTLPDSNKESALGISLGATAAAAAIGVLFSSGVFMYNNSADWQAVEVFCVERMELPDAIFTSMEEYRMAKYKNPVDPTTDAVLSTIDQIIEWISDKWNSLSGFFKTFLSKFVAKQPAGGINFENGIDINPSLMAVVAVLQKLKMFIMSQWYKYGAIQLGNIIASFGLGTLYNRMCETFGIIFSNAIIALLMAACSIVIGPVQTIINAASIVIGYIITGLFSSARTPYGGNLAGRAGALLFTVGGGSALAFLLQGSMLSKPMLGSVPNVTNGMIAMINPYNTGVSRVSDGIIIAKMIANICRKGEWSSTDGLAVGSTLMSMLLRADAMTCMVSATAGLFLGFARVYMSNAEFWFKMTSAVSVKHAETYKDLVEGQADRFDMVFDSILSVAGVLANPMSLVSIVSNIMSDILVSYMKGDTDIEFRRICVDTAQFYSGVSMIYGLSAAIFKICFQLKDSVASHFERESSDTAGILNTLSKLWGMITNFNLVNIWELVCERIVGIVPDVSRFSRESYDVFQNFFNKVWNFVKGIFKACYDWCVDKVNTLFNRAEKRVIGAIANATCFNLSLGSSISSGPSLTTSDSSAFFNLRFQKSAYMWSNHLCCPLPASTICDAMLEKRFEAYYNTHKFDNAGWLSSCGLFGWASDRWELDPKVLTRYLRKQLTNEMLADDNVVYVYISIYIAMFLIHNGFADYEELVTGVGYPRFENIGPKEDFDGIVDLGRRAELSDQLVNMDIEEDSSTHVSTIDLSDTIEEERFLLSSERLIGAITSTPLNTTWVNKATLLPEENDLRALRSSVDPRFWLKKRLQCTEDNGIIPLLVQSQSVDVLSFGSIPNEILKLDSQIYFTPDKSKGSGDYLAGFVQRPWDIVCMDNTAMVKLFSTVCPVTDNGTHITLSFKLTDNSNMHINISHSYTENAACIGMLCQTQDNSTKLVNGDLAAVEIMLWPTHEGIEVIGTCPPNTAGTWDILYDCTLKFLPFFKDLKTNKITRDECRGKFDHWCTLAAPDNQDELLDFENWKEKFLVQRFAPMGYFTSCKSSLSRNMKTLATRYSTSFAEGKKLNESFAAEHRYPYTRELVKYKSYYKDFAEAVHSRLGLRKGACDGLPDGIEDVRLTLSQYAVKAWFEDLLTRGDEDVFDTTLFWVNGKILSEKQRIHHPAVYYPRAKTLNVSISTLTLNIAKSELVRVGYLMGHNVVFIDVLGTSTSFEMAACAGVCGCTAVYTFNGNVLHSAQGWKCDLPNCADTIEWWTIQNKEIDATEQQTAIEKATPPDWLHESGGWLSGITVDSIKGALSAAAGVATRVIQDGIEQERLYMAGKRKMEAEQRAAEKRANEDKPTRTVTPAVVNNLLSAAKLSTDMPGRYLGPTGVPILDEKILKARKLQSNKNADKNFGESLTSQDAFSPAAKKLFEKKKELGSMFFDWIHGMAIAERANHILPKEDTNCITIERQLALKEKYHYMLVEELLDMVALGTDETEDIKVYLEISNRKPVCSEAPWCDGWDAVAVNSRPQDLWLTDGNTHLYSPHEIDDHTVVHDIIRVERMVNHLPKDVWADCRYKNRMELPAREDALGNVYASKAACKAQLLYEYLPNFFNNHKKFFEPCCGFGGFAQFFSHQMRSMDTREYYVSSLNMRGHAMPNWSLMQAADSNCRVIRVLDSIRDGNICDPEVNAYACNFIAKEGITMLLFDIGEKFQDPSMDDAWYLAPRNVRGGFSTVANAKDLGLSIVAAMSRMVESLPDGSDGVFKVNTFSPKLSDIIHMLSRKFKKVRSLKLATTPEFSREFYLYCSNKRSDWCAPTLRSMLLKDCIKELTWSALFRAENMYRTKGRYATRPRSHKWFTPDSSGISYRIIPNNSDDDKELDSSRLPQGHAINVKTTAHGQDVHVNLEFTPDWDRRFRRMKDYVHKVNRVARDRTGRGRDSVKFDNVIRSDFTFVKGIGSYKVKQKNTSEKHGVNDLLSSYLNSVAGMNMLNATYGQTQATPEFVKPSRKRRLDVQPGQPEPTCVVDFIKAVHCLMSDAGRSMIGKFSFMNKEDTYAFIVKTGSTGILDPGSSLREFMEIFPEWYELAWEHVLNPHVDGKPTGSYQSVRTKPEPKGRKDAEDGRLQHRRGVSNDTLREGTNLSPRFIQFSDALTRIGHIIVFGHILDFHGKQKLYKGSINGTPPHISGRVMRSYWDLHNPASKRIVHVGNNPELDIFVEPSTKFSTSDVNIKPLNETGRLGAVRREDDMINGFEDLPGGLTIDFSALDSTVTVSERMVMADLWSRFFDDPQLKTIVRGICKDMTYAICLDDAGDIWVRDGQRGSGEILTSIENTWLVTANIISAMSHALGISIESLTTTQGWINVLTQPGGCGSPKVNALEEIRRGAKYKRFEFGEIPLLVDGDDVVIISTRRRVDQIQSYMNQTRQWLSANRKVIRSGNKGGATRYLGFEELSFCSHRYEAVFIGPDASKFNPKHVPRTDGRHSKRTDLLSVAEDNNFKIYYLPIRPTADILAKLMLTLKVKTFKWDSTKTNPGECVDLTQSKLISYLLLYPQSRWVRYTCLTLLCVTGDTLATFIEFKKRYREFNEFNLKYSSKLLSSMNSLYGVSSLDDISLREYRSDSAEIRKQHYNSKLTGHVCNTTRGKWLQASFDWLDHQQVTDVYPLMWDSSVFKYYEAHVSSTADTSKISTLRDLIKSSAKYTDEARNNKSGLWWRIISFTG